MPFLAPAILLAPLHLLAPTLAGGEALPLRVVHGHAYVQARAGEVQGWWLVDTGATHTVVSPRTAHDWPRVAIDIREADAYGLSGWAAPPPIRIGRTPWNLPRVGILPRLAEPFLAEDEVFVAGILGYDILGKGRWSLDPTHRRLTWKPSASSGRGRHLVALHTRQGAPTLEVRTGSGRPRTWLLDTGSGTCVMHAAAARADGLGASGTAESGPRLVTLAHQQATGIWTTRVRIGSHDAGSQAIVLTERPPLPWVDGSLGTDVIGKGVLTWDGPGGWCSLEAEARFR